jgi:hypothetical protein
MYSSRSFQFAFLQYCGYRCDNDATNYAGDPLAAHHSIIGDKAAVPGQVKNHSEHYGDDKSGPDGPQRRQE